MAKKLFQHIAVEPELKGAHEKMRAETLKVFKGSDLFVGFSKEYSPKDADGDKLPPERKEVVTTVNKRLEWTSKSVIELLDYEMTKDVANMQAKASLEVDGKVIAENVPATTLLSLEKRLREVREYYDAIPTLDMAKAWKPEDNSDIFKFGPVVQNKTAKKTVALTLAPATKEHPAQVKDFVEDVTIGHFETMNFSGALHPGNKAGYIERIDKLIVAVKGARMRANEVATTDAKIGKSIFDYIHG